MTREMETPKAKEEYNGRNIVEQPSGNIKHSMKHLKFSVPVE